MAEHAAPLRLSESFETANFPREEQLVQAAKLAALGELVRGAAHEINNPLFGILGLVEFLLAEIEPGTKAHRRAELIHESGLEIKKIVQALLSFAREQPPEQGAIQLQDPAAAAVELLRCTNSAKAVEIVERYPSEPLLVEGSTGRLAQLFLHLLLNAQQALKGTGVLTVELSRDSEWVMAVVSDTGAGIKPDFLARAFDPFFSTKHDPAGVGLGLTVARQIARAYGGDLVAVPASGSGASLVLRLPSVKGAE
jgi:signal transduction histidine kinase